MSERLKLSSAHREAISMSIKKQTAGRRVFLKTGAAATAVMGIAKSWSPKAFGAPIPGRVLGANDRIVVAYVGTGSRGLSHVKMHKENDVA